MEPPHRATAKSLSILMVEDDGAFAQRVQLLLDKFPSRRFHITRKESVEEAIADLASNKTYDLIITDHRFPTSSGLEFALHLNQMANTIPVIFLTSTGDVKLAIEAMKLGIEEYLLKENLSESSLPRSIINVIERSKMRAQLHAVEKRTSLAENRSQAIRELVVTVCHEFNNPLAAIKISSDLLRRVMNDAGFDETMARFNRHFQKIETEIKLLRDINFEEIHYRDIETPSNSS